MNVAQAQAGIGLIGDVGPVRVYESTREFVSGERCIGPHEFDENTLPDWRTERVVKVCGRVEKRFDPVSVDRLDNTGGIVRNVPYLTASA